MAIMIKAKTVSSKVSAKAPVKTIKTPSAKAPAKTAKTVAKKAQTVREPVAKKFFLSKEVCALWAMKGVDTVPAFWTVKSCHEASEIGAAIVAEAEKIAKVKLSPAKGVFLVGNGPKGSRCVPVTARNGQYYERLRDGVSRVRGDASLTNAFVGDLAQCEAWLKKHTKKGLTDFWRSADGSKENARSAGFKIF